MKPRVLVFSGAGLSADSGLSTFRSKDGLWSQENVDKVCNIYTWQDNYEAVHEFYAKRRAELVNVAPNAMHTALAELQKQYGADRVELWTMNVDDLLERAGAEKVHHVHGQLDEMACTDCKHVWKVGNDPATKHECPKCGQSEWVKPNVVFFGESAPQYAKLYPAFHGARQDEKNTIVVIGTSGQVVSVEWIAGDYREPLDALKILVNQERSLYINDEVFDMIFLDGAANVANSLKELLTDRLEENLSKANFLALVNLA